MYYQASTLLMRHYQQREYDRSIIQFS